MASETQNIAVTGSLPPPALSRPIWLTVAVLMAVGILMVCSAGMSIAQGELKLLEHEWFRQMMVMVPAAMMAMLLVSVLPYRMWRGRGVYVLIGVAVLLLIAVQHPAIGPPVNNSQRWIRFGPGRKVSIQPSEIAKYALIVAVAALLSRVKPAVKLSWKRFAAIAVIILLVVGLTGKEDFGTAALMGMVALVLLVVGGARWSQTGVFAAIIGGGFTGLILAEPYRINRLRTFLDPWAVRQRGGFQLCQSLISIGSGGLWGRGLGNGWHKHGFLPEVTSDFIFAHICEELGLPGAVIVIALFVLLAFLGWRVMRRCDDVFGKLVALGVTLTIGMQAALHIAVVTAMVPTKGIGLPLISAGGTSVIITGAALGLLVNIARHTERRLAMVATEECVDPPVEVQGELQFEGS